MRPLTTWFLTFLAFCLKCVIFCSSQCLKELYSRVEIGIQLLLLDLTPAYGKLSATTERVNFMLYYCACIFLHVFLSITMNVKVTILIFATLGKASLTLLYQLLQLNVGIDHLLYLTSSCYFFPS